MADLLHKETDIEIVGAAAPGTEMLEQLNRSGSNVVVIRDGVGIHVARAIRAAVPSAASVLLVASVDEDTISRVVGSGAAGYVEMDLRGRGLADAIRHAAGSTPSAGPDRPRSGHAASVGFVPPPESL